MKKLSLSFWLLAIGYCSFSQNVGIGNNNPLNPLSFSASVGKKISLYPGDHGDVGIGISGYLLKFYTDTVLADIAFGRDSYGNGFTESMRIKGNGYIGIGTDPQTTLDISSSPDEVVRLNANNPFLSLYSSGVYKGYFWNGPNSIEVGSALGSNLPVTIAANSNAILSVLPNGNVGINTTLPYRRLDIIGTDTTRMMIASSSGFGATGIEFVSDYGTTNTWRPAYLVTSDNGSFTGRLNFYTNGSGASNKFGSVLAASMVAGKLGIGTQNPLLTLHVEGHTYMSGNLGIQNSNPTSPLTFSSSLGKKISLYPTGSSDVGLGVAGNRLQIFADNINADVALGYDLGGTFVERFAVKGNGVVSFNGYAGFDGGILRSTGNSTPPTWSSPTFAQALTTVRRSGTGGSFALPGPQTVDIPGLSFSYFTSNGMTILVMFNIKINSIFCPNCLPSPISIDLLLNNSLVKSFSFSIPNSGTTTCSASYYATPSSNLNADFKLRITYTGAAPGVIVYPDDSDLIIQPYYY